MKCAKCGSEGKKVEASGIKGSEVPAFGACDDCLGVAFTGHALWKAEFERLMRGGLTRAQANVELCHRIDAGEPPPVVLN